jgi:hypothetical protein
MKYPANNVSNSFSFTIPPRCALLMKMPASGTTLCRGKTIMISGQRGELQTPFRALCGPSFRWPALVYQAYNVLGQKAGVSLHPASAIVISPKQPSRAAGK